MAHSTLHRSCFGSEKSEAYMKPGRFVIFCALSLMGVTIIALALYVFFKTDMLIIFNGTSQSVTIKSVKVNDLVADSDRVSFPVAVPASTGIGNNYKDALWLSFRTFSSEVNLTVELIDIASGATSVQGCINRRKTLLRSCSFEAFLTTQGLKCGSCETDF